MNLFKIFLTGFATHHVYSNFRPANQVTKIAIGLSVCEAAVQLINPASTVTITTQLMIDLPITIAGGHLLSWVGKKALESRGWCDTNSDIHHYLNYVTVPAAIVANCVFAKPPSIFSILNPFYLQWSEHEHLIPTLDDLYKSPISRVLSSISHFKLSPINLSLPYPSLATGISIIPAAGLAILGVVNHSSNLSKLARLENDIKLADTCLKYLINTVGTLDTNYSAKATQNYNTNAGETAENILYFSQKPTFHEAPSDRRSAVKAEYTQLNSDLVNINGHTLTRSTSIQIDALKTRYAAALPKQPRFLSYLSSSILVVALNSQVARIPFIGGSTSAAITVGLIGGYTFVYEALGQNFWHLTRTIISSPIVALSSMLIGISMDDAIFAIRNSINPTTAVLGALTHMAVSGLVPMKDDINGDVLLACKSIPDTEKPGIMATMLDEAKIYAKHTDYSTVAAVSMLALASGIPTISNNLPEFIISGLTNITATAIPYIATSTIAMAATPALTLMCLSTLPIAMAFYYQNKFDSKLAAVENCSSNLNNKYQTQVQNIRNNRILDIDNKANSI